ncbi:hypothetical protein HYN48_08230 [Flavobacterium magnum]|uniref:Uncharacterized protein n=1 Tax=Flavobacterium magnum TaxID=2162713 RepID=A0A2S0REG1_9FLAO|nr:DUF6428 family protein [Flavobacterium magnum]AWA30066.1 hypothetical protein HYN48_08230 [Flavobacterium magnum]
MKLSEIKKILETVQTVRFKLENGATVPDHFHVTEVGVVSKHFIDCGGTVRKENMANFQLWDANDYEHRLKPAKLRNIIALSEKVLDMQDLDIEVEYQAGTIGKYDLGFDGSDFVLLDKRTACLANDSCGMPKKSIQLPESEKPLCAPDGNCC